MNYTGIIKLGSTNSTAVKEIKKRLNELVGSTLDVNNGNFGNSTKAEVKRFQQLNQLKDDGVVGPLTWDILFNNYTEQEPSSTNLSLRAVEIAETQLYVREKTGKNDGKEVKQYLNSIGLDEGYAWCMAFVYWCFEKASKDLGVKNPLVRTGGVLRQYNESPSYRVKTPKPGDVFIMDYGRGLGHTGLVVEVKGDSIVTTEGNTNSGGSRDGDGVYQRLRKISSINKGFLRYS